MRRTTRREFIGIAGLAALQASMARLARADFLAWEKYTATMAGEGGTPAPVELSVPGNGVELEFPAITTDTKGRMWLLWVDTKDGKERVMLSADQGDAFGDPRMLGEPGHAFQPRLLATETLGIVAVWSSYRALGDWRIMAAINAGSDTPSVIELSAPGHAAFYPALCESGGRVWASWEEKRANGRFRIVARHLDKDAKPGAEIVVADYDGEDCRRPTLAPSAGGAVLAAYDRADGPGALNIELVRLAAPGTVGKPARLTEGPGLDMAPALCAAAGGGAWVAWHTNRWDDNDFDVPRWFRLGLFENGALRVPAEPPPGMERESVGTVQGFEFARLLPVSGGVAVLGRASHNYYVQVFSGEGWGPLIRLPKDGWGGRGQFLEATVSAENRLTAARRDLNAVSVTSLALPKPTAGRRLPLKAAPKQPETYRLEGAPRRPEFAPHGDYKYYFGDIHGHTWISDGTGDIDDYFIARRDYYRQDFAALTDHDFFVGNGISPSEWGMIKELTEHYNEPGRFVTLPAQEWTTGRMPRGWGHRNLYSPNPDWELYDHRLEPYESAPKIYAKLKEAGGLSIPHHIGWTGMDWDNFDPAVTPVVEIVSVHGAFEHMGNRPILHRGGLPGHFVNDGLARGLKFGFIGGTDSHGLLFQHGVCWKRDPYRAGLAVVLAKDLTRASIFEALKARRCYATSGIFVRMQVEVNGHLMGEEFESANTPEISVEVDTESPAEMFEIIRNGETVFTFGGEGNWSRFTFADKDAPTTGTLYYYLRLTCRDGNMAWSSPVWINRPAAG